MSQERFRLTLFLLALKSWASLRIKPASSPELDKEIYTVLKQITAEFLLPEKG